MKFSTTIILNKDDKYKNHQVAVPLYLEIVEIFQATRTYTHLIMLRLRIL